MKLLYTCCLPLLLLISALVLESNAWWWSRRRRRRTDSARRYCPGASTPWHTYKYGCESPYTEGVTCFYRCLPSYTHISGSTKRTCSDGAWTGSSMICKRVKTCTAPPTPDNAYISGCDYPYIDMEMCIYHCNSGYIHVWGNAIRTCINQKWYGYGIDCRKGSFCPAFPFMANTVMSGCSAPYNYGDVCTFRCEDGYNQVSGNTTRTCSYGAWTGADLVCEIGPSCYRPPELPNTGWGGCYSPFIDGETCIYFCDQGFTQVNGSTSRTCSNGAWTGTDLFCERAQGSAYWDYYPEHFSELVAQCDDDEECKRWLRELVNYNMDLCGDDEDCRRSMREQLNDIVELCREGEDCLRFF